MSEANSTSAPTLEACPESSPTHGHRQVDTEHGFSVDASLKPVLDALWAQGIPTLCSCEGDADIRHGLLGPKHDHRAFISVPTFEDAVTALRWLEERSTQPGMQVEAKGHSDAKEYVVDFDPVATWGTERAGESSLRLGAAAVWSLIHRLGMLMFVILAVFGLAAMAGSLGA